MNIELVEIKCFLAVAELGSFSKAANVVFLTQPAISQNIRHLEEKLGIALFTRKPRKVTLTDAGQTLYAELAPFPKQYDKMLSMTQLAQTGHLGSVRIGVISTAASLITPPLLKEFHRRSPLVTIKFEYGLTADQVRMLVDRSIDVGFFRIPCDAPALRLEVVHSEDFQVYFAKGHPLSLERGPVDLNALNGETLLLYQRDHAPGYHDQIIGFLRDEGVKPGKVCEGSDMYSLVTMVASGVGVCLAPSSLLNYGVRNIASRRIKGHPPKAKIAMGYRKDLDHPPALAFIEFTRKKLGLDSAPTA